MTAFFFQAEDGIRDLVRSRGLGDVYKRQVLERMESTESGARHAAWLREHGMPIDIYEDDVYALSLIHI